MRSSEEWEDNMEDELISILESFKVPVYRQGSMSDDESYPAAFFTFWNNDSPDHSHYDNEEYGTNWDFSIYAYSSDPAQCYSLLADARAALKERGWICTGKGFDVASDEKTHIGRGLNIFKMEF